MRGLMGHRIKPPLHKGTYLFQSKQSTHLAVGTACRQPAVVGWRRLSGVRRIERKSELADSLMERVNKG
jgi:hypothetical protein